MRTRPGRRFWLALTLSLFIFASVLHYIEQLGFPGTIPPSFHFGLTRHAVDRILFLVPIVCASYAFGLIPGLAANLAALLVMLPRAIVLSPRPVDASIEVIGISAVGVLASLWLWTREKERRRLKESLEELESAHRLLRGQDSSAKANEQRLTILNAIGNVLTESLELDSVLKRATNMVSKLMNVEFVLIYSLDEMAQELVLLAHEGVRDEFAGAVDRMRVGEGFNGQAAATGQPVIVEDASSDPRLTRPEVREAEIQSQLIVPVIIRGNVRGTLCVATRRQRQFLPEEIELTGAVAAQVGAAIENARLYEKERSTAKKLAKSEKDYRELFENANDAIWVHDMAGNIVVANRAAGKLTGYTVEELSGMNLRGFLSEQSRHAAARTRRELTDGRPVSQPYEQRIIRKDGTEAIVMIATGLVIEEGEPVAFQHIARDVTEERRMQDNLRYYLSQITNAQEEERKRIARELHDDMGQALHAMSRQIDNFLRANTDPNPTGTAFLAGLRQQLNDAMARMRLFSQALRPPMLDDLGLLPSVRWLVSEMKVPTGAAIDFHVTGAQRRLPTEVELALFRIIQEALTNVWKHAQASQVDVTIEFSEDRIMVSVRDNGVGFGPETRQNAATAGKLGLLGMEERMHLLGGSLEVRSTPGKGTTLVVEAPL